MNNFMSFKFLFNYRLYYKTILFYNFTFLIFKWIRLPDLINHRKNNNNNKLQYLNHNNNKINFNNKILLYFNNMINKLIVNLLKKMKKTCYKEIY